jgi:fatty-acyl-CoA synthase
MHAAEMTIAYGMTETSPVSVMTRRSDDLDRRTSTVGMVIPHVEVKIVDANTGGLAGPGEPGELCSRGYVVMKGYWNDEAATRAAIDEAGWMHTGDLATMDEYGYVNIVGRLKDMVIRGGENIYPREIEEVLFQHPTVASAQVIGVPDARMGEELMAWVTFREGQQASEDDLRTFCRERLAHFKVPRYWKVVSEFPMTVTGKIQKFKMREVAIEELGLQDAAAIRTA